MMRARRRNDGLGRGLSQLRADASALDEDRFGWERGWVVFCA